MAMPPLPASRERPTLELSGPKLALAFETLVAGADEHGGVERYVEAVQLRARLFRDSLGGDIELGSVRTLCAHMATVRRRVGPYLEPSRFDLVREAIAGLLEGREIARSEERRVGKECPQLCRSRWSPYH